MAETNYWTRRAAHHPRRRRVLSAYQTACAGAIPAARSTRRGSAPAT